MKNVLQKVQQLQCKFVIVMDKAQQISYIACCWQQAPLSKIYILLALKMPKQTDVDGPACAELGTGRD